MKKFSKSLLVALFAAVTLSACGGNGESSKVSSSVSSPVTSTPAPSTSTPKPSTSTPAPSVSTSTPAGVNVTEVIETALARVVLPQHNNNVVDDFTVPSSVTFTLNDQTYTLPITWVSDKTNVEFEIVGEVTTAKLTRPSKDEGDVTARLTATVEFEGQTKSKTFKVNVVASNASDKLLGEKTEGLSPVSHSEFVAAANGTVLQIKGIVTAAGYNPASDGTSCYCIFIEDEDGGYYSYRIGLSKAEFEKFFAIGNEVIIEGKKDVYNGLQQLKAPFNAVEIVSTGHTVTPKEATKEAKGAHFDELQSTYVTVLGTYVIKDGGKYLQVGSNEYQIYQSEKYNCNNFAETEEQLAALQDGDVVRLTGVVGMYTVPQFYVRNIVKTDEEITATDDELAYAGAAEALKAFDSNYYEHVEIALPEVEGVELSYALNAEANTEVFNLNTTTKVLEITPADQPATATLTITAKVGEETSVETIEITAATQLEIISIEEANTIAAGFAHNTYSTVEYYIKGTLGEITNTTYGNTTINGDGASLTIYGMYKDGKKYGEIEGDKPETGDIVILKGVLGTFNGTNQMKNATIHEWNEVLTTEEAAAIAATYAHDTYSDEKYYVRGTIDEVYNTQYGNMYLDSSTLTVYGTYSADGIDRYDAMTNKPDAYDEVLLYGILGTFNGANQMKNGWIIEFTANDAPTTDGGDTEEPGTDTPVETPTVIDFNNSTGYSTSYGEYKDVKVGDYSFYLSCGNKYTKSSPNLAVVGLNKDKNIGKVIDLPAPVAAAIGSGLATGTNAVNAVLEMKFDVNNVKGVTYNFTKIGTGGDKDTTVYILKSVDGGATYEVVASTTNFRDTSLSYTAETADETVRFALVVCGYADANYSAQARVSTIQFTLA